MKHTTQQHQNPAQASSKAKVNYEQPTRKDQMQQQALENAVTSQSVANFQLIFEGFEAMGIPADEIKPRINVFTFNAWKALGRVVKKGEHGVKIVTLIPCTKKDKATGEDVPVKKIKATTVFHISQTQALDGTPNDELTDKASDIRYVIVEALCCHPHTTSSRLDILFRLYTADLIVRANCARANPMLRIVLPPICARLANTCSTRARGLAIRLLRALSR